jgi:transcription initiation factor TFIID subunit TAF12
MHVGLHAAANVSGTGYRCVPQGEVLLMPGQTAALTNAAQSYLHTLQQLKAEQRMACHSLLGTTSEALSSTRQVLQQQQEAQALVAGLRQKLVQQQLALVQLQHSLYTEVSSAGQVGWAPSSALLRCMPLASNSAFLSFWLRDIPYARDRWDTVS